MGEWLLTEKDQIIKENFKFGERRIFRKMRMPWALICSAKSLNQVTRIIIRILCLQQKCWSLMNPILKLAPARFIQLIIFKPKNRVSVGFVEECFSLRTSFVSMQWMTTLVIGWLQ